MNTNETVTAFTYSNAHKSRRRNHASTFECIGNHKCSARGSVRVRKLWKLADCENGIAYWRPRGEYAMFPVCKIEEL